MKDKNKNEKHNSGSDTRDGMTQGRIAWPEKVALSLQACGTEKQGQWFTHKSIRARLVDMGHSNPPEYLDVILKNLIKSGHIERAIKPESIRKGAIGQRVEYIYRRTSKPYTAQGMGHGFKNGTKKEDLQRGFQLRLDHPRLPKWFRDMMQ